MSPDAAQIKENIISFLEKQGPSLPVHIAGNIGQSILFTSAFLSELLSDKRLKISNMRVGSSAIHFLPGQEPQLEKFSNYLKSKEKEAYLLLKEKRFLKDSEVEPAIRVALRSIKDFAFPFENNGEVYWRYLTATESEFKKEPSKEKQPEKTPKKSDEEKKEEQEKESKGLDIFDKENKNSEEKSKTKKNQKAPKSVAKKTSSKSKPSESARNKFFNKAKDFLTEKNIEILGIEEIAINKIIFKVKDAQENETYGEYLIVVYNKKRITEEDIIKAYKKSEELKLKYKILSFGNPMKKTENIINAAKTLKGIEKIE